PVISINTIAGDDVINATEKGSDLALSGTSDQPAGTTITVTLNGQNYSATTDASGNWSVTVPASAVSALGEATYSVTASVTNAQGNSSTASHNVQVNTALPGVTLNPVATDDIINAAEAGSAQTISGQVTGAAAGSTVTVELGGKTYTAIVQVDLSWNVSVPAADWQALGNGELTVNASVTNAVGNTGSGTRDITIDASLPGLRVDTVAGDDVVNIIEHAQAQVITGSSSGFAAGTALTVVINNQTYAATVLANGSWSVGVPAADVSNWPAGTLNITVSGANSAGTQTSITHPLTVDLTTVAISMNSITSDDVINAAEKGAALTLSGSTSGVEAGQAVTVTFGGKTYTTTVAANGSWSTTVPAADLAALRDGDASAQVRVTNVNGNSATATHEYSVDSAAPTVTINTIASDNIINASEAAAGVTVSGTSTAQTGQMLTVTLNGTNYQTTVQADGSWSLTLPATDLTALANNGYTLTATVSDLAGNPGSASKGVTVDTTAPVISFNTVAGDDVINNVEHTQAQIISGTTTGAVAGDRLVVTIAGQQYVTSTDASGNWSVGVPASVISGLADGTVTISATITDSAGNSSTQTHNVQVNTAAVSLSVSTISGDNIINAAEAGSALTLSGTGTNFATGTVVTVLLNGKGYSATIQSNGSWSVNVPAADVAALSDGTSYTVSASAQDSAGNSATASRSVAVDLTAPVISINTVSTDDRLSAAEQQQPLTLNGSTSAEVGQTVTVTFGGKTYSATVAANGSWSTSVPAADMAALRDGDASAQASVSNVNGNSATTTHAYSVDASAPTVTINTIAGDDILNAAEAGAALTITGSSTAEAGQTVTVTLNGENYTGTVQTDGSWSVSVPQADVSALTASNYTVNAAVSDKAGNPASVNHNLTVDTSVPVVTINTVAGDDVINATEHAQAQIISGSATGVATGSTVTVTIGTNTFTTVLDASGNWSVGVPASVVSALANGTVTINASVTDAGGNSGSTTHQVTVNTGLPTITFNAISGDNVLNADEKGQPLTISGGSTGLATGAQVTVTLNGHNYSATTDASGNWTLAVPVSDLAALGQANYTVSASATSAAGNTASSQANLLVDSGLPDVTINTVAGDDIINAAEAGADQTISGVVTRAAAGDTVTVTLGGNTYTAQVQPDLSWSVTVPAADLQALGNGDLTITASVTNANGNTGSGTRDITIDANLPGLRVDTVAGDDIVNSIEHGQALVITGGSSGLNAGVPLTITINGTPYSATVQADGSWSVGIPAANVSAWPAGALTVDVAGQSSAGNPVSVSHPFTVDLTAVAISINTVASDDVINAAEKGTDLTLSGSTSGIESGQTVTVTFGGKTYTASVAANGSWSVNVPAADLASLPDGAANVQASVSSASGNSASATHAYSVDASAPTLTINTIASDDILNAAEAGSPLTISGTSTAETGQTVTVTLNGATYTGNVQAGGSWSVSVPSSALGALSASNYTVSATVNDKAGNPGSASHNLAVDTTAPVLTINTVAGDDIINDAEHAQALVISGTSTGGEAGDVVSVVLNGKTYTTTLDASGNWSVGVPAADVAALGSGAQAITASVSDRAGNSDDASRTVTVSLSA
ncbi:Ig-like domain-containing protein, partial [Escherichia coli]|uniref:beta strand repeat-containing protein n=1 Tax=Escherichia coli TaxID=562 RepID=UPI00222742B8